MDGEVLYLVSYTEQRWELQHRLTAKVALSSARSAVAGFGQKTH